MIVEFPLSSPRVRGGECCREDSACLFGLIPAGARKSLSVSISSNGLIPAGAGSTCSWCCLLWLFGAHPRGCGEHHLHNVEVYDGDGLIPADAGST